MSASIGHLLIHSFTVQHKLRAANGKGGYLEEYEPVGTVLRGRINPATNREIEVAQQKQAEVTHVIYFDPATDILVNDRILFEGRGFRVTIPNADTPSIPIYQKCFTVEIQRG